MDQSQPEMTPSAMTPSAMTPSAMTPSAMTPSAMTLSDVDADLVERARAAAVDRPELEDVLQRLDGLDRMDVEDHPGEFEAIHELLRAALDGVD